MRLHGFLAVGLAAALTACSGGGSFGTLPTGPATTTAGAPSATVRTVSENDTGTCSTGGRHGDAAQRGALDRDHGDGGGDGASSGCCPAAGTTGGTGTGPGTGTRDRDRGGDGGSPPASTCCTVSAGSGGTPTPGPGTRDRDRGGNDGDGHHATPTPAPTPAPCPPALAVTPASVTIDCAVSPTATIVVKGTPPGIKAVATDPTVATVSAPIVVDGNTRFTVTGVAGLSTTIKVTDTAGDTVTVPVTTKNCPLPTPSPSPVPTPTPGR